MAEQFLSFSANLELPPYSDFCDPYFTTNLHELRLIQQICLKCRLWSVFVKVVGSAVSSTRRRVYDIEFYVEAEPCLEIGEYARLEVVFYAYSTETYYFEFAQNGSLLSETYPVTFQYGPFNTVFLSDVIGSDQSSCNPTLTLFTMSNPYDVSGKGQLQLPLASDFPKKEVCFCRNKESSDVVLNVHGNTLLVQSFVLSSFSPTFKNILAESSVEWQRVEIPIYDFKFETILEMVKFIYTHEAPVFHALGNCIDSVSLYEASHKYGIQQLLDLCRSELINGFTTDNVLHVLNLSTKFEDSLLRRAALEFASNHSSILRKNSRNTEGMRMWPGLEEEIVNFQSRQTGMSPEM